MALSGCMGMDTTTEHSYGSCERGCRMSSSSPVILLFPVTRIDPRSWGDRREAQHQAIKRDIPTDIGLSHRQNHSSFFDLILERVGKSRGCIKQANTLG